MIAHTATIPHKNFFIRSKFKVVIHLRIPTPRHVGVHHTRNTNVCSMQIDTIRGAIIHIDTLHPYTIRHNDSTINYSLSSPRSILPCKSASNTRITVKFWLYSLITFSYTFFPSFKIYSPLSSFFATFAG